MTKLTPEKETQGLKAYEQVRAFEALQRRGLPWIYAVFTLMMLLLGGVMLKYHQMELTVAFSFCTVCFAVASGWSWRREKARYAENLTLLAGMEHLYGDQLPWVQVEKHFAALEKLQSELAEEKIGAALKDVVEKKWREEE